MVVDVKDASRNDPNDEKRNDGDDDAKTDIKRPVPYGHGVHKAAPGGKAHGGEKEADAGFSHHEVGRRCREGYELKARTEPPEQDRDNEGTARKAELERHGKARNGKGDAADEHTRHQAHKDRDDVRMVELTHLIAELLLHACNGGFGAHAVDLVSHLQVQFCRREKCHAGTKDARNVDAVDAVEGKALDLHAVDGFACHHQRASDKR